MPGTEKMPSLKNPHGKSIEDVIAALDVDPGQGLGDSEAGRRLKAYGSNKLEEQKQKNIWQILLSQVNNPVVYLKVLPLLLSFC